MEELALGAQPLHHVDALAAEKAHVAAADVDGKLFPEGALWEYQTPPVTERRLGLRHIEVFGAKIRELEKQDGRRATNEVAQRYCYNHTAVSR